MPADRTPTDPLRVDFVDLSRVPGLADAAGRLGMTSLPGARDADGAGPWRDPDVDARRLRHEYGADAVILLVADDELIACGVPDLPDRLREDHGLDVLRHPIADMGVPSDRRAFRATLVEVRRRVRAGDTVVVACRAGLGRTGMVVACLLVDAGLAPNDAIVLTRASRPGAIESAAQESFVRDRSRRIRGGRIEDPSPKFC